MPKKIYIAGPMTGYPEFNFPAFYEAEARLKALGWRVFNPANKEQEKELNAIAFQTGDAEGAMAAGFDFRECYTWDVCKVIEADAIYMLKGWEGSTGGRGEHAVAMAMKGSFKDAYQIFYEAGNGEYPAPS